MTYEDILFKVTITGLAIMIWLVVFGAPYMVWYRATHHCSF